MINKKYLAGLVLMLILASLAMAVPAFAATSDSAPNGWGRGGGQNGMTGGMRPAVVGTVEAINGSSLTVDSKSFGSNQTDTVYAVDVSSATISKNGEASSISAIAVGDTVAVQGTISGSAVKATLVRDGMISGGMGRVPGVYGTVSAVNGSTLSVTSKATPNRQTGTSNNQIQTTYTVDATKATVTKNGAASSVSAIAIGDVVMVEGTVNGTSVTATSIRDGVPQGQAGGRGKGAENLDKQSNALSTLKGNGQPVVGGSVTAVSGSTLTISNSSNVTYTIDASAATIVKNGATSTISSVLAGDSVFVQGTVNGNSVTASTVLDQGNTSGVSNNANVNNSPYRQNFMGKIFGGIGSFFKRLFGF